MNIVKKAVMSALTGLFVLGLTVSLSAFARQAPQLQSITVNPERVELEIGREVGLYAIGNYSDGSTRGLPAYKAYLTSTVLNDGKVLVTGGYDDNSAPRTFDEAELYDPTTGTFSRTGTMTIMRDSHTATRLADGRVLLTGGYADAPVLPQYATISSAEIYNPATGNFQATGSMSESRAYHTATLLGNGKVLITGGAIDNGIEYIELTTAELYDPATGTFSPTGEMSTPKSYHTATLLTNGQVLIVGGGTNVAELYDPSTGTFSDTGSMAIPRFALTATLLENGQVLIAGDMIAELYDPSTGIFTTTGSMVEQRYWAISTLLGNGKVLIAGGGSDTSELYDPETGTFSATGTMEGWRSDFTDALLGNGNVLVIGGSLPMAEIYDTQTGLWQNAGYDLGDPLVWSNSDESIAASAQSHGDVRYFLTGLLTGTTTITATSGNISGSAQVIVGTRPYVGINYNSYVLPGSLVQLYGYGSSYNPGGYIASYSWIQIYGAPVALNSYDTATTSFTAPNEEGWLNLQLTVVDNIGMSSSTSAYVYVSSAESTTSTTTITTVASTTTTTWPDVNNGCTTGECDANYFCVNCHNGLTVNGYVVGGGGRLCAQRTATEWVSTIDRMNSKGCGVPTVRINRIANYLASLGTGGGSSTAPTTTTTSGGGTTTTRPATTTTTNLGSTTTVSPTTTTTLAGSSTTTTGVSTTVTSSTTTTGIPTTVATTTTTTVCRTYVNGTTEHPYSGTGSCHGHNDNGDDGHVVREEKWCQKHMDHFNNAGNHTHAFPHPTCM